MPTSFFSPILVSRLEIGSSSLPDEVEEVEQPFMRRRSSRVASSTTEIARENDDRLPPFEENKSHMNESNLPSDEVLSHC